MNSPRNDPSKSKNVSEMQAYAEFNKEAFEAHMRKSVFGGLVLPDAIRPDPLSNLFLQQGFRESTYSAADGHRLPVIQASINADVAIKIFCELISVMGKYVLLGFYERSDDSDELSAHWRDEVDPIVMQSILCHYEREILSDGGISIVVQDNTNIYQVVA